VGGFEDIEATLDPDIKVRGQDQFEPLVKWWLENDPEYRTLLKRVWRWHDWPGRDGPDIGIDLVAEAHDGGVWAIQAKCTRADLRVKKAEVDSFLAASAKPPFTFRLLVTSSGEVGPNATRAFAGQHIPASYVTRARLIDAEVEWPTSVNDLTAPSTRQLRRPLEHQQEAIDAVVSGLAEAGRGQLIMACGTGKTLTSLFITEQMNATRTLVLVPSLSLLSQTFAAWTADATTEFQSLAVCSDESVTSTDEAVAHTTDLGVPVTTDPDQIRTFLRGDGHRVVFATYQSSPRIADAYTGTYLPPFDLVIADEAHRCAGPVTSDFATILDPKRIPAARRLFMTATPRYFTGRIRKRAGEEDHEIASMDDEATFGPVLHRLAFSEAIDRDLLSDYQVAVVVVDDRTYLDWAQQRRFVTRDGNEVTDAATLGAQIGLAKAMAKYDLHRVISFHGRVAKAKDFASSLPSVIDWMPEDQQPAGTLHCAHVSGTMPAARRSQMLRQLARLDDCDRALLANARCLSEGVNVPALDGVAFIDPRRSQVDIIQAVGRAIRKATDKTVGTIVIPVFVHNLDDAETALQGSPFKPVWDIINSLRDHDDSLGAELDDLRRNLGRRHGPVRHPQKIHLDLPTSIDLTFASVFDTELLRHSTSRLEEAIGFLQRFADLHGHARVPATQVIDGFHLGAWVKNRRIDRRGGRLNADLEARLETMSGWSWDPIADQHHEAMEFLQRFVDLHGHAQVSRSDVIDGFKLGAWAKGRRRDFRLHRLDADLVAQLEALPGWSWDPRGDQFAEGLRHLQRFVDLHGHAQVSQSDVIDGFKLGTWVNTRRTAHQRDQLSAEHEAQLEALPGWSWDPRGDQFAEGLRYLQRFVDLHGHARVPVSEVIDGFNLGTWVNTRRTAHQRDQLSAEHEAQLEALPGWSWDPRGDQFAEGLRYLQRFVDLHGHARVPVSEVIDGFNLGTWVANRRARRRRGRLSAEHQAQLEAMPGWIWDPRSAERPTAR
jgi:superfamily II DNA or RNA helicase